MSKEKARLAQLSARIGKKEIQNPEKRKADISINPNPPHGERGAFRKVTITLPPAAYELLVKESARRKIAGEPDHLLAAIAREAITEHLAKKNG